MAQFLHLFETVSAFTEQYNGEDYEEPWVSYTKENTEVNYNKPAIDAVLREKARELVISGQSPVGIVMMCPDTPDSSYVNNDPSGLYNVFDTSVKGWGYCMFSSMTLQVLMEIIDENGNWNDVYGKKSGMGICWIDETEMSHIIGDSNPEKDITYPFMWLWDMPDGWWTDYTQESFSTYPFRFGGPVVLWDYDNNSPIFLGYACDYQYAIPVRIGNKLYLSAMPYIWD